MRRARIRRIAGNDSDDAPRQVLIISNEQDLAADLVVLALRDRGVGVARCNTERLSRWRMTVEPGRRWRLESPTGRIATSETTASVWWRRPEPPVSQTSFFSASHQAAFAAQWQAALEALASVPGPRWLSSPAAIRAAEDKAIQLATAGRLGFCVPRTSWTNDAEVAASAAASGSVVAKPITTAAWDEEDGPAFVFAQLVDREELPGRDELALLPVAFQRPIWPKRDVRVTVIGHRVLAAVVAADGHDLDWRLRPDRAWAPYELGHDDADRCAALVAELGLRFAGIDLAIDAADQAWFLEANPNGEWGWLAQGSAGLPIVQALADELTLRDV